MALNAASEKPSSALMEVDNSPGVVFQPQKLTEIVEMIDLMGSISDRVREDSSGDMGGGGSGSATGGQATGKKGASPRDIALANLPVPAVMQVRLTKHIRKEMKAIDRQVSALAGSNAKGSAYLINELYKKIRRLHSIIEEIVHASSDMIKRFYVAVFVDKQPVISPNPAPSRSA